MIQPLTRTFEGLTRGGTRLRSIFLAVTAVIAVVLGCDPASAYSGIPVEIESQLCGRPDSPTISVVGSIHYRDHERIVIVTVASGIPVEFGHSTCTRVSLPNDVIAPAELLAYDSEAGLAALEIKLSKLDPSAREFRTGSLRLDSYENSSYNAFVGKFATKSTIATEPFKIVSLASHRHFIPKVSKVIEITGPSLSSRYRGAPVFGIGGGVFGIVSDQHLPVRVGHPGLAQRWIQGQSAQHLLVIPSEFIHAWLSPFIYGRRSEKPWMILDSKKLATGDVAWKSTDFEISEDKSLESFRFGMGDMPAVGGIDQSTDPPGIGGSGLVVMAPIQIRLRPSSQRDAAVPEGDERKRQMNTKLAVLARESAKGAKVLAFARTAREAHWDVRPVPSVDAFMASLSNPHVFLVPVLFGSEGSSDAAKIDDLVDRTYEELEDQFMSDQALHLLRQLKFLSYFARSSEHTLWTSRDYELILNRDAFPGNQWRTIEAYAPDLAREIHELTLKLRSSRGS